MLSIQFDRAAKRGADKLPLLGDEDLTVGTHRPEEPGTLAPPERAESGYDDESPLVVGGDGDDVAAFTRTKLRVDGNGDQEKTLAALAPGDLSQSGHGFVVRSLGDPPKTEWRQTCEVCGDPMLPLSGTWVCEVGHQAGSSGWNSCRCNWCLLRGLWLRGQYRPQGGRPAKRCGTAECTRKANRERKRQQRERESMSQILP